MSTPSASSSSSREFKIKILGRTLEHLGVQTYKRREPAIVELVANCWDAGATHVWIDVPLASDYNASSSTITIRDDGGGMSEHQIQDEYLVIGRNRRRKSGEVVGGRLVLGRKGIGKLAGFGIAQKMTVTTWKASEAVILTLDAESLKRDDSYAGDVPIHGVVGQKPPFETDNGTLIELRGLKHVTPLDPQRLHETLARRFARTIRGEMTITLNGAIVGDPAIDLEKRFPEKDLFLDTLPDGSAVKFFYGFSKETIQSPELRGFSIYFRGKTAQAPPFFFSVEGTASGQHATRYVTGEIYADFLDTGKDEESDLTSTDRQEIDWDADGVKEFKLWGETLSRRVLREWVESRAKVLESWILEDQAIKDRIDSLDKPSQQQITRFLKILSEVETASPRARELADSLVQAYEFRNFHDVIVDLEQIGHDPEKLQEALARLSDWRVLESRAILEVIKGRLDIIDIFQSMLIEDAPETTKVKGKGSLHDLIAGNPWLLDPDWQILAEEKSISRQLREWNEQDIQDVTERMRYDFLALADDHQLIVIEIKRSTHPVSLEELQRLERYSEHLSRTGRTLKMVLIYGGKLNVSEQVEMSWRKRGDAELLPWGEIFGKTRKRYGHYKAILEKSVTHPDFARKQAEVLQTRQVLSAKSVYRGADARAKGIGPSEFEPLKIEDGKTNKT